MLKKMMLVLAIAALAACSKVTSENYSKLESGMEFSDVQKILGAPDSCSEALGTKSCVWGDDKRNITVNFIADKMIAASGTGLK
ncbi:MAG: DUF3862 domain-containing protein [Granulosicoccaceae bacterium]|jgi:hypothetical protein